MRKTRHLPIPKHGPSNQRSTPNIQGDDTIKHPHTPWSIQIELTHGCNRHCDFCYKQVLEKNRPEFMSVRMAERTAHEISIFNPTRLKFALRGEPTLNPYWHNIIHIFHKKLPDSQIILTTNGDHLTTMDITQYYEEGGNTLLVDCYNKPQLLGRARQWQEHQPLIQPEPGNKPYQIKPDTHNLILITPPTVTGTTTRKLSNMAGNITPEAIEKYEQHHTTPLEISCSRPFGEMNILHDGTITYCCHDGGVEYPLWHIDKGNLYFYWNHHPMLQYIRQQLYQYNRNHTLCQHCNYWGGEKQITTTTPSPYNNTPPPPSV